MRKHKHAYSLIITKKTYSFGFHLLNIRQHLLKDRIETKSKLSIMGIQKKCLRLFKGENVMYIFEVIIRNMIFFGRENFAQKLKMEH